MTSSTLKPLSHYPAMEAVFNTFELAEMILLDLPVADMLITATAHPALRTVFEASSAIRTRINVGNTCRNFWVYDWEACESRHIISCRYGSIEVIAVLTGVFARLSSRMSQRTLLTDNTALGMYVATTSSLIKERSELFDRIEKIEAQRSSAGGKVSG